MNRNQISNDQLLTFHVPGNLISTNADALSKEINSLLETPDGRPQTWHTFTLDLASATMVDSVGLNLIATLLKRVQKKGAKMAIAYSSPNILRTLMFTRLDKHVDLVKV